MNACILTIGDELLQGFTTDTNSSWLGSVLLPYNITIQKKITVGDDINSIIQESQNILSDNYDFLFVTGGLGPTHDDITKEAFRQLFDDEFIFGASDYRYTTQPSDGLVQYHDNFEFDFRYSKNITREAWSDAVKLEISGEFSAYENSDDDGVKSVWMKGDNLYLGVSIKFPAALKVYADYMNSSFDLGTHFSRDKITVGFNYNLKNFI